MAECEPCTEEVPAYLQGSFTLTLQREGDEPRDIGNIVVGTFQDEGETFFGTLADGSDPTQQSAFFVRQSVNLIVTADEITCENLRLWLEGDIVNIPGGQQIMLEHVIARDHYRAVASRDLCDGSSISIILHRVAIVTTSDLLFQSAAITGNQFTLRALRDANYPDNPYGYVELVPSDCQGS